MARTISESPNHPRPAGGRTYDAWIRVDAEVNVHALATVRRGRRRGARFCLGQIRVNMGDLDGGTGGAWIRVNSVVTTNGGRAAFGIAQLPD